MQNENIVTEAVSVTQKSFYAVRMSEIGLTDQENSIQAYLPDQYTPNELPLFTEDNNGNIVIWYYSLKGEIYTHQVDTKNNPERHFYRTRFKEPITDTLTGKSIKYKTPKGGCNYLYFPPYIRDLYKTKTEIPLLIITEGEFKSYRACKAGIPTIGISGIHNLYNKGEKTLDAELVSLIKDCKVKKILFLTDADSKIITFSSEKDLSSRPTQFYAAVRSFRDGFIHAMNKKEFPISDIFYGHIKTDLYPECKGIDDLLNDRNYQEVDVFNDLNELHFAKKYFQIISITDSINRLKTYFGLDSAEVFFDNYKEFIGAKEFIFHKRTYYFDEEKHQVCYLKHEDVDKYMRIGCDWFKKVAIPNKHGDMDEDIKKWKVNEISRDYKKYKDFIDEVPKYEAWCNIPQKNGVYNRVINNCFNLFHPIPHTAKEGNIENTLIFLKHIFGGQADIDNNILGDSFTVALDYLTLMWQEPTQILPIPCLVSEANGTGKSTFLKWLRDIYGSNATIIDNERFKQSFNSHYITKFIIGIDESFLDVDKKSEKERLKKMATDDRQNLEFKGADIQEIDFYGKIILCSNDEDNIMKIDEGEIRWFIVKVPKFKGAENPTLRESMRNEIPAWLHFLSTRTVFHPNESRAWFSPKYIETEQLKVIQQNTKSYQDKVVEEFIMDQFFKYGLLEIKYHLPDLVEMVNKTAKYKIDGINLKKYLKKRGIMPGDPERFKTPTSIDEGGTIYYQSNKQRYYLFKVEEWLTEENLEIFNKSVEEEKNHKNPLPF
jgi:hypothetical protein